MNSNNKIIGGMFGLPETIEPKMVTTPHESSASFLITTVAWQRHNMTLLCDQRYSLDDMSNIVTILCKLELEKDGGNDH